MKKKLQVKGAKVALKWTSEIHAQEERGGRVKKSPTRQTKAADSFTTTKKLARRLGSALEQAVSALKQGQSAKNKERKVQARDISDHLEELTLPASSKTQTLNSLVAESHQKFLPFVVAFPYAIHRSSELQALQTDSEASSFETYSGAEAGKMISSIYCGDDEHEIISTMPTKKKNALRLFCEGDVHVYAIQPDDRIKLVANKQELILADKNASILADIVSANEIDFRSDDDLITALHVAGLLNIGLHFCKDTTMAKNLYEKIIHKLPNPSVMAKALIACVIEDSAELLKSLLDLGTDPGAKDDEGWDALSYARNEKIIDIIEEAVRRGREDDLDSI